MLLIVITQQFCDIFSAFGGVALIRCPQLGLNRAFCLAHQRGQPSLLKQAGQVRGLKAVEIGDGVKIQSHIQGGELATDRLQLGQARVASDGTHLADPHIAGDLILRRVKLHLNRITQFHRGSCFVNGFDEIKLCLFQLGGGQIIRRLFLY